MEYDFDTVMSKKTNEELIKIVKTESSKYQPLAIESAKKEIDNRNIDLSEFHEIEEKLIVEKDSQDNFNSSIVSSTVRFANFIIDFISFLIIDFILTGFAVQIFNIDSNKNILPIWFLMLISFILNYAFMEHTFQKTIGKFITKTKVVNLNGEKPILNDIVIRTFCRLIPFDRLSFFFSKNGFHDAISNTRVVRDIK
ncbi:MAG: RDD family protein [Bacteroidota bacterium]